MGTPEIDIEQMVREYLDRFHRHYKLDKNQTDREFADWCLDNLGREYRDWMYHAGSRYDSYSVIHIQDPKRCTIFELRWSDLILGTIDRNSA